MPPEETAVKVILDKPLHQLTEDDIAQVTREDCRRYLKEKGTPSMKVTFSEMKKLVANFVSKWCFFLVKFFCAVFGAGMRRPSWNKSQAIQQVIMLKKLLEASPDSDAGSHKKLRISLPDNSQSSNTAILESVRYFSVYISFNNSYVLFC